MARTFCPLFLALIVVMRVRRSPAVRSNPVTAAAFRAVFTHAPSPPIPSTTPESAASATPAGPSPFPEGTVITAGDGTSYVLGKQIRWKEHTATQVILTRRSDSDRFDYVMKIFFLEHYHRARRIMELYENTLAGLRRGPHVMDVAAAWHSDCCGYVVMEGMPEKDVLKYLYHNPNATEEERKSLMIQACEGLAEFHKCEFSHLDFKPENAGLRVDNGSAVVKLIDFDFAGTANSYSPGSFRGTHKYASPECEAGVLHRPNDVFSLGVAWWEVLEAKMKKPFRFSDKKPGKAQRVVDALRKVKWADFGGRHGVQTMRFVQGLMQEHPAFRPTVFEALADPYVAGLAAPRCLVVLDIGAIISADLPSTFSLCFAAPASSSSSEDAAACEGFLASCRSALLTCDAATAEEFVANNAGRPVELSAFIGNATFGSPASARSVTDLLLSGGGGGNVQFALGVYGHANLTRLLLEHLGVPRATVFDFEASSFHSAPPALDSFEKVRRIRMSNSRPNIVLATRVEDSDVLDALNDDMMVSKVYPVNSSWKGSFKSRIPDLRRPKMRAKLVQVEAKLGVAPSAEALKGECPTAAVAAA